MPRVKKMLDEYFKSSKIELGQHLNGTNVLLCIVCTYVYVRTYVSVLLELLAIYKISKH